MAIAISKAWGDQYPVKVREVALELGGKQQDPIDKIEPIAIAGIEGMLARKAGKWGIAYSSFIREQGKVNFTIAHELGHYLAHRKGKEHILCTTDDLVDFSYRGETAKNMEQEANDFASYLLMPITDFRVQIDGHPVTIDLLAHCGERYETSLSATALKLISFTEKPIVVIASESGKVRWSRSSDAAFRMGVYFKKGAPLPLQSRSYGCAVSGTTQNCSQGLVVPSPVWSLNHDVVESAVAQPNYGTVFTVIEIQGASGKWGSHDELDSASDAVEFYQGFTR